MKHSDYAQFQHAQDIQRQNAWNFITSTWHTPEWKAIPESVRNTLNLPSLLGMYSGMLCSKTAAQGAQEFIHRLNTRRVN